MRASIRWNVVNARCATELDADVAPLRHFNNSTPQPSLPIFTRTTQVFWMTPITALAATRTHHHEAQAKGSTQTMQAKKMRTSTSLCR